MKQKVIIKTHGWTKRKLRRTTTGQTRRWSIRRSGPFSPTIAQSNFQTGTNAQIHCRSSPRYGTRTLLLHGARAREPLQNCQQEDNSLHHKEEQTPLSDLNFEEVHVPPFKPGPWNTSSAAGAGTRWADSGSGSDPSSGGSLSSSSSTSSNNDIWIPSVSNNNNIGRYYDKLSYSAKKLRRQQHSEDTIQLPTTSTQLWSKPMEPKRQMQPLHWQVILTDPTTPKHPSQEASKALFCVLCAQVISYLRNQLQETAHLDGTEDGFAALMHLRDLFADQEDDGYKLWVKTDFQSITLRNNEPIFDFNKWFGILYRNMVGANVQMEEKNWDLPSSPTTPERPNHSLWRKESNVWSWSRTLYPTHRYAKATRPRRRLQHRLWPIRYQDTQTTQLR